MKIAVIGPGAMGLLYGTGLSRNEDVILVGNNPEHIRQINENGITVKRDGNSSEYHVKAALSGVIKEPVDLVILFTKAYLTEEALNQNRELIGGDTILLSLQNGMGHEEILCRFADKEHVLTGTTAQGSYRENAWTIVNSGLGDTTIGAGCGPHRIAEDIAACFERAGFPCIVSDDIKQVVWNKLMINASSSVLSGILQKPQGWVVENSFAWDICRDLIREICCVAESEGCHFDVNEQWDRINRHLKNAPGGYTSIYSDIKEGRKTEVDHISGAVAATAKKHGIAVPMQETMVRLVHSLENRID